MTLRQEPETVINAPKADRLSRWVWIGFVVLAVVTVGLWVTTFTAGDNTREDLRAAGDAVAAVAALAAVVAVFFAIRQVDLQRRSLEEQGRALDEQRAQLHEDHRLQLLTVLRKEYAEFLELNYAVSLAFKRAGNAFMGNSVSRRRDAIKEAEQALHPLRRLSWRLSLLDGEPERWHRVRPLVNYYDDTLKTWRKMRTSGETFDIAAMWKESMRLARTFRGEVTRSLAGNWIPETEADLEVDPADETAGE